MPRPDSITVDVLSTLHLIYALNLLYELSGQKTELTLEYQ